MAQINYNERSWAIDIISAINAWASKRNISIKRAGGENTLKAGKGSLFPDVLLFGDLDKGRVLQGWELKMPDTSIDDAEFIKNAKIKAKLLSLNSFLLWNVSEAVLYKIEDDDSLTIIKRWRNLSALRTREEVSNAEEKISVMLDEILTDLNGFITSGKINATSIVKVLSSETISDFIQKNIGSYIDALSLKADVDSSFDEETTLWWRYAKNDYPEENNKFVVLARNNLLFLVNKFLFAHILKSYQSDAAIVNGIDKDTDIKTALKTFELISQKCDFWNIFQSQRGEEVLTKEVWQDILGFNSLLKEFNFEKIEKGLLHDLIGLTVYRDKRKFAGQFTTPIEVARLLVNLSIKDKAATVIDPCCGTGTILKEVYNLKKTSIDIKGTLASLWGSDKFSLPLQMAMFNLADPEALGCLVRIFKYDATELRTGQNIELREPFKGDVVTEELPRFKYITSNLPFVQQEDLEVLNPEAPKINEFIAEKVGDEFVLDGRSDLYAYLPFYFWRLLDTEGGLAIITSNSWLGTSWGHKFYETLQCFFNVDVVVISGKSKWFENAAVVTDILILSKKDVPARPQGQEKTKFVVIKEKLGKLNNEELKEIVAIVSLKTDIEEEDISVRTYSQEEIEAISMYGVNLNSFFAENSWLKDIGSKLIKISTLFNVARGERRGWDELFYPENGNGIEEEYLKPVLKTPRSISKLVASPDAAAFCCDKTKEELQLLGHTGALNWINRFEGKTNESGVPLPESLARAGTNWYTMLPTTMGEIVTSINFGDRLFFARFDEPTFVNQRLIRFTKISEDTDTILCHALMNSILGLFYIEAMGTGRGLGALDLSKDKIEDDFRIINPSLISEENKKKIISEFKELEQREIYPIEKELEQADRENFDNAVLNSVGIMDKKAKIKTALLTLYKIRIAVKDTK